MKKYKVFYARKIGKNRGGGLQFINGVLGYIAMNETVLVTGCSSGIGYHVAKGLKQRGYNVYTTARKEEDVKRLISEGFKCLQLDYADSESVQDLANELMLLVGTNIYGVFHNGAYGQPGAVEDLSRDVIEKQFAANVFGWMELNNRLIVLMRHNNRGRIVFNSSVLGLISLPFRGAYNASKYAIEGFADTLRLELSDTNVKVSLIEPGPISSKFRKNALKALNDNINMEDSVHRDRYKKTLARLAKEGNVEPYTLSPQAVLEKVIHAFESEKPKAHYYVTKPTYVMGALKRLLPTSWMDKFILKTAGQELKD